VHHGGPIVGIDVETACPDRGAVCAIGVAVVFGGAPFRERHWYVNPGTRFDPRFIEIHRITPGMVEGRPTLRAAWGEVLAFIEAALADARPEGLFHGLGQSFATPGPQPLYVAHNAQFDRAQIEASIGDRLPFRLACTVAMSRRAFPELPRHNLKSVSTHLRIALQHHDALSDARACALIAQTCLSRGAGA
jgi:DNA polymerase III epsilon subunit-like protein